MSAPSDRALVPFVSVENMRALVHKHGLRDCLAGLANMIEADFKRWPVFDKTPRVASHSKAGVIELMPTSDGVDHTFKSANGHRSNTKVGLQTLTAVGVLASVDTVYPQPFSEMTLLTALRTVATSAMVTRILAPKSAKTAASIGNGIF
ncbi:Ornithine cyclodeaminase/mu-crystallin family protein [Ruegeria faecimaris]|uniref:Ornithine cyclodeaminase/mu-crystallin family protein n=1 Tax=Ruegeria faecimaris TaxID=686389 RepID=A0A521BUB9_9RHOB|nr:Ornithine cyclodeaminase/mu-crystallin family protein [Ruegeria faecimaris]